ncbi:hypothetical protein ONE63_003590 [Megalurothrips usitatus]|uniref:Uncharacterized protein n=1 Tax=Megalurothrips usitatus TaxID=439358 RepID=A0AAV7X7S2_9NEOP|nr:hypothetical protein ONE63_003590 [Megalurothrips usitatus]
MGQPFSLPDIAVDAVEFQAIPRSTAEAMAESAVDSSLLLWGALQREIAAVRGAVDVFDAGRTPTTDRQVPYVDQAAAVLTAPKGRLKLKIRGSSPTGEDVSWETSIPLLEGSGMKPGTEMSSRQSVLARLALYFLHTRGRLTKVEEKTGMTNIDNNLYLAERHQLKEEKAHYLETDEQLRKAKRVRSLCCSRDPEWSLRALQVMAPQIEELSVDHPGPTHLAALGAMPRLRRLKIWQAHESFRCDDFGPFSWDECTNDPADPTKPWRLDEIPASHAGVVCLKDNFVLELGQDLSTCKSGDSLEQFCTLRIQNCL